MKTLTPDRAGENGHTGAGRAREFTLGPPESSRRVRVPELLVGAALTVGFALAAVLWHANSTQRDGALVVAGDVARGETIDAGDLRVVYIGTDDAIARLSPSQGANVIGHVAVANITAGTLITSAHVTTVPALGEGEGVVGLALDPGQFPAGRIAPGDVVNVVVAASSTGQPITEGAVVYAVESLGGQGRRFISLRTTEANANRVAAAAEAGHVRLVLVGS